MDERDSAEAAPTATSKLIRWAPWALLAVALLIGTWSRIRMYGQSVVADELSTLWIVQNHGLSGTVSFVSGDGEISPPLYFLMAWFASKLGSAPELIRLPSMLAAALTMPLYYLLGSRLFDRRVGLLATSAAALSPMLIYTAATGRAYSVALLFLLVSTVTLLKAIDSRDKWWWVAYGVSTAAAMYCHYTVAFILVGQLIWALAYHPAARKGAILANLGAVVLFLPWVPGYLADADSPTTPILEALQGHGFEAKRTAVEQVLFWEVTAKGWTLDRWDVFLLCSGIIIATVAALVWIIRRTGFVEWLKGLNQAMVLTAILVLATPVGSFLLGRVSTDTFGTRNLAMAWLGLPIAIGAVLVAARRFWGTVATVLVMAGLAVGAFKLADSSRTELNYHAVATKLEKVAKPTDSVVSTMQFTPVPLTPLDLYLDPDIKDFELGLPSSEPPFLPGSTVIPSLQAEWKEAFSGPDRVFVVSAFGDEELADQGTILAYNQTLTVPKSWEVTDQQAIPGVRPLTITTIERRQDPTPPKTGDE